MEYGKLHNEDLRLFKRPLVIYDPSAEILKEYGYYPVIRTPKPAPEQGYEWVAEYELVNEEIIETWVKVPEPGPGPEPGEDFEEEFERRINEIL